MVCYYVGLESKSHVFLLEQRMIDEGIVCDITYMPRNIMIDLCNMGLKFHETELTRAMDIIRSSGLPGCRLYREDLLPDGYYYCEVQT